MIQFFRLVAILKSINKILEKQRQRNPLLRQVVLNLSTISLKNTYKEICILESYSVSRNKIFEIHSWKNSFCQFSILLVIFVIGLDCTMTPPTTSQNISTHHPTTAKIYPSSSTTTHLSPIYIHHSPKYIQVRKCFIRKTLRFFIQK